MSSKGNGLNQCHSKRIGFLDISNMLKDLARRWANHVSRGTRSLVPSMVLICNGLLFVLIYILGVRSEVLLGLAILIIYVGFHLFERAGLLMLLDGNNSASEPVSKPAIAEQTSSD